MKRRVFEILNNPRPDDVTGRGINLVLLFLIATNVSASVLETDASLFMLAPGCFLWLEQISVAIFTLEYGLRLWACSADPCFEDGLRGRLRLALRPMSLVDLCAIAPFYVELFLPGTLDLRFLRALRLLRVFRVIRFGRFGDAFAMLTRVVRAKSSELGVTLIVLGIAVLISAGVIYAAERDQTGTAFTSIPRSMWWSIVTITTVGYGDMTPTTPLGKIIGGLVAFSGICIIALPVGLLSTGFFDEINRVKQAAPALRQPCPHCGRQGDDAVDLPGPRTDVKPPS